MPLGRKGDHVVGWKMEHPKGPHKGWTCTSVEDLNMPDVTCEMYETQDIRYVHHMEHPD